MQKDLRHRNGEAWQRRLPRNFPGRHLLMSARPLSTQHAPSSTPHPLCCSCVGSLVLHDIRNQLLVVAQYISLVGNQAGVFTRGERSVASAAVYSRLKPFVSRLEKALRRELFSDTKYFLHKVKKFQTDDAAKWDKMGDWLHQNANAYQDALRRIMRGSA